jgi:hypothetical protein
MTFSMNLNEIEKKRNEIKSKLANLIQVKLKQDNQFIFFLFLRVYKSQT